MVHHEFKTHPSVFAEVRSGAKNFEFRKDDRGGFHPGQRIRLRSYSPEAGYLEEEPLDRTVTFVLRGGEFGLQEGFCILALTP